MNKDVDFLADIDLPSIELDLSQSENSDDVSDEVSFNSLPTIENNQLLVDGATDFKDHPHLEPLLKNLLDLQLEFHKKVKEASEDFELTGFVKVLFAVRAKPE